MANYVRRKAKYNMSRYEKRCSRYWLEELENRRLTLLSSTLKDDLRSHLGLPHVDRFNERLTKRMAFNKPELPLSTVENFFALNTHVGTLAGSQVDIDRDIASNARLFIVRALERFTAQYTDDIQCSLDLGLLLGLWRYGPGASIGCDGTHFAEKISQATVSCTERAAPYFKMLRSLNPHTALNDLGNGLEIVIVEGSSLSTVPKNEETHRTICTEPLGNMALQLAAGVYIEGALHCCGVDLATQPAINRRLAYLGSLDGCLATIDLKSASDMITPALIKCLWPPSWYAMLDSIRSPSTQYQNGVRVDLNMMSTMGNGFTFPMMTLTLLALVYGYNAVNKIGRVNHLDMTKHAVFGDDIICPSDSYEGICSVLVSAGLIVNTNKSYNTGSFRESCGGDYNNGRFITPPYVQSLSSDSEIYSSINKILGWCGYHRIPLVKTISLLVSMLSSFGKRVLLVPEWESPDSGILTAGSPRRYFRLTPLKVQKAVVDEPEKACLIMLMVLGGYVESRGDGSIVFSPRQTTATRYDVEAVTRPKNFVTGTDPSLRGPLESLYIERLVSAVVK